MIYGNGLTIYTNKELEKQNISRIDKYLDYNFFMKELLQAKNHNRIRRKYDSLFDLNGKEYEDNREKSFTKFREDYYDIARLGFERWVSLNLFNDENPISSSDRLSCYLFYNYWYDYVYNEIISDKKADNIINDICSRFISKLSGTDKIYTTNFDITHDKYFSTKHLHGKFQIPLKNGNQVIYKFLSGDEFEYKFLLGTNGYEKIYRITRVSDNIDTPFDKEFLFDDEIFYGHMLIVGLAFGRAEVMSDEFYKKYPKHEDLRLVKSVDGHITMRLEKLLSENKLEKITMSYYSEKDLQNYKSVFMNSSLNEIIEYKTIDEIIR